MIEPGKYDEVAVRPRPGARGGGPRGHADDRTGGDVEARKWLAAVAGTGARSLVPEKLIQLDGKDLDILIYPMDLLISGKPASWRARGRRWPAA